jgi:hypothetical protein
VLSYHAGAVVHVKLLYGTPMAAARIAKREADVLNARKFAGVQYGFISTEITSGDKLNATHLGSIKV